MRETKKLVTFILASALLLLGANALPAAAAAPTNTFPGGAATIDNQSHSISANASLWYRFEYAGDRSEIMATLVNGTNSGLAFEVYTSAQISKWWENPPIGRGTPVPLNCQTNKPRLNGGCQGRDLRWLGSFNARGTYYIRIINLTGSDMSFQLVIAGTGLRPGMQALGSAQAAVLPTATAAPTAGSIPSVAGHLANTDPDHATALDGLTHSIEAHASQWYRFNYAGDRSEITVTLLYAANSGLAFNVFTPAEISNWWEAKPIGRGTIEILDCDTNQPDYLGHCQSDYLRWIGKFNAAGTYYVELVNNNAGPTTAQFMIAGSGVSR